MNKIKKIKIRYFILFISILICVFSIGMTNSRYTSAKKIDNELPIAKPIIEFESVSTSEITNVVPGDTIEYNFNIKNTDGTMTNEVAMNYYIKLSHKDSNLPLKYKIYDITSGTEVELPITSEQTSVISLGYGEVETHKYKIKFIWPISNNDEAYANKQTTFDIEIYAEQAMN